MLLIAVMFILTALPIMSSVQFKPSETIALMFSSEHQMWTFSILCLIAYGLIVKGWNNTRLIRAYCVLNIIGLIAFYYVYLNFSDNYYLRIISFPLASIFLFTYLRYRHIIRTLYTRWMMTSSHARRRKKALKAYSLSKITVFEVFLVYLTLVFFLIDILMASYLAIYQAYFEISGPLYIFIEENNHFNPFAFFNILHRYGALISAFGFALLIILEIKSPDHSGKPEIIMPRILVKMIKLHHLNWRHRSKATK